MFRFFDTDVACSGNEGKGMMYDDSAITKNVELVRKEGMKKLQTVEERKHAELLKI